MSKKILIFFLSFCLLSFASSAYAVTNKQIKQTRKPKQIIKVVRFAKVTGIELNYNTLSVKLSYMPVIKHYYKGRIFNIVVADAKGIRSGKTNLEVLNSNAVKKAYYIFNKNHTLIITVVLKKRFKKSRIEIIKARHVLIVKFPTLKNHPLLSYPKPESSVNNSGYNATASKTINISLKNITMLVSPAPIKKIIYSKNQGIQIIKDGDKAFIKILPLEEQKPSGRIKYIYDSSPRDIYILSSVGTYSLNLLPRRIPSLIVTLKKPQIAAISGNKANFLHPSVFKQPASSSGISESSSNYNSSAFALRIVNLIKDTYFLKIPNGYSSFLLKKVYRFAQVTITGQTALVGKRFIILIYKIRANMPVNLHEKEFLWMSQRPVAISIVNPVLGRGESTRLFIVEGING